MGIIIYPPTIDWNYMKQRPQHLMKQFADAGHIVFYFNKKNYSGPVMEKVADRLYIINHANYFMEHIYPILIKSTNIDKLYWCSWIKKLPFSKLFQVDYQIYDCVDNFPDWEEDEKNFANTADVIVVTANELEKKMKQLVPLKPTYKVENGCDWEHFAKNIDHSISDPISTSKKNTIRIGYVGAWADWVDEKLVEYIADHLQESEIIIVGPNLRSDSYQSLRKNILFAGYKDYQDIPEILSSFDVCILPFRNNQITTSTNPIKIYEYLSAGKPVVSTDLPEVRKFTSYVKVAENEEEFVDKIIQTMTEKDQLEPSKISQYAEQFSWKNRFNEITEILNTLHFKKESEEKVETFLTSLLYIENKIIPLVHGTVNSYYKNKSLPNDPPFVGKMKNGEYQCYIKLPNDLDLTKSEQVFLEVQILNSFQANDPISLHFYKVSEDWDKASLTFNNKPPGKWIENVQIHNLFNQTCSIDITHLIKNRESISFQLTSESSTLIRIAAPQLVLITKKKVEGVL